MAADPAFAATVRHESGAVATANTSRDKTTVGSGTVTTVLTAGSSGSKIDEITIKAENNPADSIIIIWLYDGSNYHIYDEFDLGDPVAGSTTVTSYRDSKTYRNLRIPSGWSIRATITVAPTTGVVEVHVDGGDF